MQEDGHSDIRLAIRERAPGRASGIESGSRAKDAIKVKCLECEAGSDAAAKACKVYSCALFLYAFDRGPIPEGALPELVMPERSDAQKAATERMRGAL